MPRTIEIPDFDFSAFYYNDILTALINYRRVYAPEITDENDYEPFVQLERAYALVGHLNNVLLDFVAKESLLPTASLRSSVKNILKLIGYELSDATPSIVDLLIEISTIFTTDTLFIPEGSEFSTRSEGDTLAVLFENLSDVALKRTDRATAVFALEAGVYTDYTVKAYTPADPFTPWAAPAPGDMLYIAHQSILWDILKFTILSGATGLDGTWEYYDGLWDDAQPDDVTSLGTQLRFDITTLLMNQDRHGATVRVTLNTTGAYEDVLSEWDGTNYITTSLLGQTTPSLTTSDYTVGVLWHPLADLDTSIDGTTNLQSSGNVDYDLPVTLLKSWNKSVVNGHNAYWIRYRIVNTTTPVSPSIDLVGISEGKQYVIVEADQGSSVLEEVMGSSTGLANQTFKTLQNDLIQGSQTIYVDDEEWTEVQTFLNSGVSDKHYTFESDDDGYGVVKFGNGINGRIPPAGADNVTADYRVGASQDGNVGAGTIVVNGSGVAFINRITNPKAAYGWTARRGDTPEDLELVKVEGPATVSTLGRAVGPADVEALAVGFITSGGSKPISRALTIEEAFGVKTVGAVLVGTGGSILPLAVKEELENYFNGNATAGIDGVLVLNHRVFAMDYSPKTIDIVATVYGGTLDEIVNAITALLHPEAKTSDGLRYEWDFGDEVPRSRLISEIFTVAGVRKVVITTPSTDITLLPKELPMAGSIVITVEP